jgi:hypothetical protein
MPRHDRTFEPEQLIQQTRLAHVGTAHNRHPHPLPQHPPFPRGRQQLPQIVHHVTQPFQQLLACVRRNVFLRKIQVRLHVRQRRHERVAQLPDPSAEFAGQLFLRRPQRQIGPRMYNVRHRLSLGQIQPPVQKSPLREFPRLGKPRALREHGLQHGPHHHRTAVTRNFNDILAGERARRAHHRDEDFVNDASFPHHVPVVERM